MQSIRPVSLVKSTERENCFTIEHDPLNAVDSLTRDRPKASIACNLVLSKLDSNIVQVRCIGAPQLRIVDLEVDRAARDAVMSGHDIGAVLLCNNDLDLGAAILRCSNGEIHYGSLVTVNRRCHQTLTMASSVSIDIELSYVVCGSRFQPHRLPDTTAGSIEDVRLT